MEGFLYQNFPHNCSIPHNEGCIDHEKGYVNITIPSIQTNNIHIQVLINITQEKNLVVTKKR